MMAERTFYDNTPFKYGYSSKQDIILPVIFLLVASGFIIERVLSIDIFTS